MPRVFGFHASVGEISGNPGFHCLWLHTHYGKSAFNAVKQPTVTAAICVLTQGSILAFFQTRQPGKYIRKDTCPDKILLARSKLRNN